jgi:hypothetical protein
MDSVLPGPPLLVEREEKGGPVDDTVRTSLTTKGPEGAVVKAGVRRTAEGEGLGAPEGGTRGRAERRSVSGRLASEAGRDLGRLCTRRRPAGKKSRCVIPRCQGAVCGNVIPRPWEVRGQERAALCTPRAWVTQGVATTTAVIRREAVGVVGWLRANPCELTTSAAGRLLGRITQGVLGKARARGVIINIEVGVAPARSVKPFEVLTSRAVVVQAIIVTGHGAVIVHN